MTFRLDFPGAIKVRKDRRVLGTPNPYSTDEGSAVHGVCSIMSKVTGQLVTEMCWLLQPPLLLPPCYAISRAEWAAKRQDPGLQLGEEETSETQVHLSQ